MSRYIALLLALAVLQFAALRAAGPALLFEENFEVANFASRGWYDGSGPPLTSAEHIPGSSKSAQYHWRAGATTPAGAGAFRHKFTPSESIYVSYWVKYSSNYTGSNKPYHPHEFTILTTKNADYAGPAYTHLTAYIEHNEGRPVLALQDGQNIDETRVGQDLINVTENRSVAGCNGNSPEGYTSVDCYRSGAVHWNAKIWKAPQIYFQDAHGPRYKSDWHHIEAFFKLNTVFAGKGAADGQLRYWFDGELVIESTNVIMRTAANADMKWNQFLVAPYIGDGSPVEQTMWVDDLRLATDRFVADSDSDSMPDDWERIHGLDPRDASDAALDFDADRFTNLAEYLAGTNPRDAASALTIVDISVTDASCTIRFATIPGKRYQLERADDLVAGGWSPILSNIAGTGAPVEVTDSEAASPSSRYYRLRLT